MSDLYRMFLGSFALIYPFVALFDLERSEETVQARGVILSYPEKGKSLEDFSLKKLEGGSFEIKSDLDRVYSVATQWRCMSLMKVLDPISHRIFEAAQISAEIRHGLHRDEIECYLSQTLTAYVVEFHKMHHRRGFTEHEALGAFNCLLTEWRINQVRSCVLATVQDELDKISKGQEEGAQFAKILELQEKISMIEASRDRGLSMPSGISERLEKLKQENNEMLNGWAESASRQRPKVLDYFVRKVVSRPDDNLNIAALTVRGNKSPGQRASESPIQVIGVEEAAELFDLEKADLTKKISGKRKSAIESDLRAELYARPIIRSQDLWTDVPVPKGGLEIS